MKSVSTHRRIIRTRKLTDVRLHLLLSFLAVVSLPFIWWTHLYLVDQNSRQAELGDHSNVVSKRSPRKTANVVRKPGSPKVRTHPTLQNKNLSIIAIGCNRVDGLLRTLHSAERAAKAAPSIGPLTLHICIDACRNNTDVRSIATDYEWHYGNKRVTLRTEQFGLAKHITSCWENPQPNDWALFLEDDVELAPEAFVASAEALQIRDNHERSDSIIGIALHDSRVNQYCWNNRIKSIPCPKVQKTCGTDSDKWTILGHAMCLHDRSNGASWYLNQIPSSWGAWYEGRAWSLYKQYFEARVNLPVGESLLLAIPHSMSNEWDASWKRFLLELMFRAGWSMMYRADPEHQGFSTTRRSAGVHTAKVISLLAEQKEKLAKCLVSTPLADTFTADQKLANHPNSISSFDYCSGDTSMASLAAQGIASVTHLQQIIRNRPSDSSLNASLQVMLQAIGDTQDSNGLFTETQEIMSSGYNITFLAKAEIIMVTSFASIDRDFKRTAEQFASFDGLVHFLIAAPTKVRSKLVRGNIFATCIDESHFTNGYNKLPVIREVLKSAVEFAGSNVQWIGVMDGDIMFSSQQLPSLLRSITKSSPCADAPGRCALLGQRYDIDWNTKEERIHSAYGMDYFIFNRAGLDFMLRDGVMPEMTFGLVRWDIWLVGFLSLDEGISVIDVTDALRVEHYMEFQKTNAGKQHVDRWNLRLADERTDNANYRINGTSLQLEVVHDKSNLRNQFESSKRRFEMNLMIERSTDFTYTTGPLPTKYFGCLCDLLGHLSPGKFTSDFCAPSHHLAEARKSHPASAPIYFFMEAFQSLTEEQHHGMHEVVLARLTTVQGTTESQRMCCMLTEPYGNPGERTPDKFWTFDAGNRTSVCLTAAGFAKG